MKTLLWGMAIFSEKSHQQGRDPSLNPLFSATRSLSTREQNRAATPPASPLSREYTFSLMLNAQMTVVAYRVNTTNPVKVI